MMNTLSHRARGGGLRAIKLRAGRRATIERMPRLLQCLALTACLTVCLAASRAQALDSPAELAATFEATVASHLVLPAAEQDAYAGVLKRALETAGATIERSQFVVLVDRNANVQAAMVWWLAPDGDHLLIGAAPASTGRPTGFEHFETPLGVFEHSLAHPDFRAEGTPNEFGILGYGDRGMRVYDFGWVVARRGWAPGEQAMRLQLHATDRLRLEARLGQRESKGCIRIPAALNQFIDRYGVLDAAYDDALAQGRSFWVLRADRVPTPWAGRYLVVVDTRRSARPAWSPPPRIARAQARKSAAASSASAVC